jgi:hypothetical protein
MCIGHEDHYTDYTNQDGESLCFRHATMEALKGVHIDTSISTLCSDECYICNRELIIIKERQSQVASDRESLKVANEQVENVEDMLVSLFHISDYLGCKKTLRRKIANYINRV